MFTLLKLRVSGDPIAISGLYFMLSTTTGSLIGPNNMKSSGQDGLCAVGGDVGGGGAWDNN